MRPATYSPIAEDEVQGLALEVQRDSSAIGLTERWKPGWQDPHP
ncbi:MAG: hypothetical protein WCA35_00700 [Kovacikia sp.]